MPENFLIVPSADITNGRIDTLANTITTTDLNLTVGSLQNGTQLVVYQLSQGVMGTPRAIVGETHVFALLGQSNMIGRAGFDGGAKWPARTLQIARGSGGLIAAQNANDGPSVSRPLDHINPQAGDMGLDIQFAIDYLADKPNVTLVFIACAQGGTGFSTNDWNRGDPLYLDAVGRINAAMSTNPTFTFKGFLWHQGESDQGNPGSYQGMLDQFITDLRTDVSVATDTSPFILGGLGAVSAEKNALTAIIADTPNRVAHTAFADASDLTLQDANHFDAPSLRLLGARYQSALAVALANAAGATPVAPGAPVNVIASAGDAQITMSWSPPSDTGGSAITDYILERDGGAGFGVIADGITTATGYVDSGLNNATPYAYRIRAVNGAGTGAASQTVSATPVTTPTGGAVPEAGAEAHWLFGADNTGYADLLGARVATGPAQTLATGYMTSPAGSQQGLDSTIPEGPQQTMCFVFRLAGSANSMIGGTLMTGGDDGGSGVSPFTAGSNLRCNMRGGWGNATLSTTAAASADFVFVAISKNAATGVYILFTGNQSGNESITNTANLSTSPRNIGIGNLHYNSAKQSGQISIAEAIIFNGARTLSEMEDIYQRSRTRLLNRGVTVL